MNYPLVLHVFVIVRVSLYEVLENLFEKFIIRVRVLINVGHFNEVKILVNFIGKILELFLTYHVYFIFLYVLKYVLFVFTFLGNQVTLS